MKPQPELSWPNYRYGVNTYNPCLASKTAFIAINFLTSKTIEDSKDVFFDIKFLPSNN
jgi:hypothetical protein